MNANDIKTLRRKKYSWREIADVYGKPVHEVKAFGYQHGLTKHKGKPPIIRRVPRLTRAVAIEIGKRTGRHYNTIRGHVYANPDKSLAEIEAMLGVRR